MRILPEWKGYDDEIKSVQEKINAEHHHQQQQQQQQQREEESLNHPSHSEL